MQMKKGERALCTLAPRYAAGAPHPRAPSPPPPDAAVTYEITLVDFVKAKDTWDMTPEEKVGAVPMPCKDMRHKKDGKLNENEPNRRQGRIEK